MTRVQALDVLLEYMDMLRGVLTGPDRAAMDTMVMAYRDWEAGDCDSGSGVPDSDLETRLSRVIEALA